MVAEEQQQQQYKYLTQPQPAAAMSPTAAAAVATAATYDNNKNSINAAPAIAVVPLTKTNGYSTRTETPPMQQIDKHTGQPIPAPRRTNSVPQADGSEQQNADAGAAINGNASNDSAAAQTETQVCFISCCNCFSFKYCFDSEKS